MTRMVREMNEAEGIRSYGPGKFYTLIDSWAYELALDGGADEEESYGEGGGWYGLLWLDDHNKMDIRNTARDKDDELTEDEETLLIESKAIIFFERSDGIVEADWFASDRSAEDAWAQIQAEFDEEEEEEDEEEEEEEDEED